MFGKVMNTPFSVNHKTNKPNKVKKSQGMNYISVLETLEKP